MRQLQVATELTNDAVLYALAASLAFLTAVLIFDPKLRKSPIGKSLIMLDIGLAGLEAPSVLHRFLGLQLTEIFFAWYFLGSVAAIGTAVWWRTFIMIAAQVRGGKRPAAQPAGDDAAGPPGPAAGQEVPCE